MSGNLPPIGGDNSTPNSNSPLDAKPQTPNTIKCVFKHGKPKIEGDFSKLKEEDPEAANNLLKEILARSFTTKNKTAPSMLFQAFDKSFEKLPKETREALLKEEFNKLMNGEQ